MSMYVYNNDVYTSLYVIVIYIYIYIYLCMCENTCFIRIYMIYTLLIKQYLPIFQPTPL